jgi:hypothetical protein
MASWFVEEEGLEDPQELELEHRPPGESPLER